MFIVGILKHTKIESILEMLKSLFRMPLLIF